jgi:1-acyl-sn-glycerol-3-phosphate acyltransferase
VKRLLDRFADLAVGFYYRRTRLGGGVPADGPLLLVANHPNGLVDPVLVAWSTSRDVRLLAKAPLFRMPVLGGVVRAMGAIPVYRAKDGADTRDNAGTFDAVAEALDEGCAIALFPEGGSATAPSISELKTGAARMALSADADVRIVPVGLVYLDKVRFRSRVAVWVGEPVHAARFRTEGGAEDREAVRALTGEIASALEEVTVNLDAWEDLPLLRTVERIWQPARGARRVERMRLLAAGLRRARELEPERVHELAQRVQEYSDRLERFGMYPDALQLDYDAAGIARFVARNLVLVTVVLPFALLGAVFWWLPWRAVGLVARAMRPEPEMQATVRILAGVVLWTAWYAAGAAAASALIAPWAGPLVLLAAPGAGLLALRLREAWARAVDDVAVFFRRFATSALRDRLRARGDALAAEVEQLAREVRDEGRASPGA